MRYEWTSSVTGAPIWNIPVGDDPDALAWRAAVIANGGATPSVARQTLVGTLIQGLKATGVWAVLDRLWVLAAADEIAARTDIKARVLAVKTGTPAFTTDRGYTGTDSLTSGNYLQSDINPFTFSGQYTLNSAHLSIWLTTNLAAVNSGGNMGMAGAVDNATLFVTFTDNNVYARINEGATGVSVTSPQRTSHWISNRTGATASQIYRNGINLNNINSNSTALPNGTITILGANIVGNVGGNPNTHAMASIGGGLTASQAASFYQYLRDYMNAIGAPP